MGEVKLVRIDSRLSHGKTCEYWMKDYGLKKLIIANDRTYEDDFRKEVMDLTIPEWACRTYLRVDMVGDFLERNEGDYFLLVEDPEDLYKIVKSNVYIKNVNIGIIHMREGKKSLTEEVSVSERDIEILKNLLQGGADVFIQLTPYSSKRSLRDYFTS